MKKRGADLRVCVVNYGTPLRYSERFSAIRSCLYILPVMALWAIAGPRLGQILTDALANVSGP